MHFCAEKKESCISARREEGRSPSQLRDAEERLEDDPNRDKYPSRESRRKKRKGVDA